MHTKTGTVLELGSYNTAIENYDVYVGVVIAGDDGSNYNDALVVVNTDLRENMIVGDEAYFIPNFDLMGADVWMIGYVMPDEISPVIDSELYVYMTNVNTPTTIANLRLQINLTAWDEVDGDITDKIIIRFI